ncbi:LrgB-like family-domain-containing protein [Annulohypoxylon truncatum]|uniref:LrgB-like family-domain-containing protein n=1 Tax=Annulohypoxylon truncatum TaxID=327061 RepID=UPI0020087FEB|nr:LrgB-like family-domain-containing protein [Annulohypoxylon truncatum]KAI1210160.1 LrgB-like family-domain-containing protein [Annulohypoxylon truncatum]
MTAVRKQALDDLLTAVQISFRHSRHKIIQAWLYVPFGIILMLLACFGVKKLFDLGSVTFPSSVACLIILFLALLLSEQVLGEHRTKRIVGVIEVPGDWALRWINVLFTPSFVLLPLSPSIGGIEVLKMIAVFVIGFIVMMVLAAYMTRSIQLILGSSKRAMTARAEELNPNNDEIPMTAVPESAGTSTPADISDQPSSDEVNLQRPPPSQDVVQGHRVDDSSPASTSSDAEHLNLPPQSPVPPSRSVRWAAIITTRLDLFIYTTLFLFVGLPMYYAGGYAMPLHLTVNILTYFGAMSLPLNWRTYLHPVLVSSLFTVLSIWVLGLLNGVPLPSTLTAYKTGSNYAELWTPHPNPNPNPLPLPGAGDLFSSVLDASIVSFALPVYRYRRELRQHLAAILVPNIAISVGSLFAYPAICHAIGISAPRSLAFAARSLTLALAVPAAKNLGGDANAVAALAIMSGIVGVLVGQRMLGWLRIPEDDYVTRGVTLGANSSAIAAALLLRTDPRAAALSILAMSLFGTITVLFTSIPPMTIVIQSLVGM